MLRGQDGCCVGTPRFLVLPTPKLCDEGSLSLVTAGCSYDCLRFKHIDLYRSRPLYRSVNTKTDQICPVLWEDLSWTPSTSICTMMLRSGMTRTCGSDQSEAQHDRVGWLSGSNSRTEILRIGDPARGFVRTQTHTAQHSTVRHITVQDAVYLLASVLAPLSELSMPSNDPQSVLPLSWCLIGLEQFPRLGSTLLVCRSWQKGSSPYWVIFSVRTMELRRREGMASLRRPWN